MSAGISIDESVLKNLKNAMEYMISEETKYIKSQLILNICEEFTPKKNGLSNDLCNKIRSNLILADLNNKSSEKTNLITQNFNVLGINFEKIDNNLTLNEMQVLNCQIKNKLCLILSDLDKKLRKFKSEGLLAYRDNVSSCGTILSNSKMEIQKSHQKFVGHIIEYNNLLDSNKNLLSDIIKQHVSVNNLMINYFDTLDKNAVLCNLKARILLYKIEQVILSKNDKIFDVLLLLHDDLKKKEEASFDEFNRVTKLLDDYKNLDKEEFKAILKKYDYMKKKIDHFLWTLKEFSM